VVLLEFHTLKLAVELDTKMEQGFTGEHTAENSIMVLGCKMVATGLEQRMIEQAVELELGIRELKQEPDNIEDFVE
jgi:hypothetical protein